MVILLIIVILLAIFEVNFDYDKEERKLFVHYTYKKERKVLIL